MKPIQRQGSFGKLGAAFLIILSQTVSAAQFAVFDLGTLGGNSSHANAINDSGQVVGYSDTLNGERHAFLYSGGTMQDLGTLGGTQSIANAINSGGTVVGSANDAAGNPIACYWNGKSPQPISGFTTATAINSSGQIVVNNGTSSSAIYFQGATGSSLGLREGWGINSGGTVCGYYTPVFRPQAATVTNGVLTDLGPAVNRVSSWMRAINDSGNLAGGAQTLAKIETFFFSNESPQFLGSLSQDGSPLRVESQGINSQDQIVGYSRITGSATIHAFLWENGVIRDLNGLIDPSSGWVLSTAYGINNLGEIAGSGVIGGQSHAFLLRPIPTAFALFKASSRKNHGGANFDVVLPLVGPPGVECRSGGIDGRHTLICTFTRELASGNAVVTTGQGKVAGSPTFSGTVMSIPLAGVSDVQKLTVNLNNVVAVGGETIASADVEICFLLGDASGNQIVNSSDIAQSKANAGLSVAGLNFRTDVDASGTITASDVSQIKVNNGHFVP